MPNFRAHRIAGRIVKLSLVLFVAAVNAIIIWRVFFSANIPSALNSLVPNSALSQAYETHGKNLHFQYQDQLSLTYSEDNRGYFGIPDYVYIPEANQIQVVFRYNNSTLRHLKEDFGLAEIPDKKSELFDVTLLHVTEIESENASDTAATVEKVRIFPSSVSRDTTLLYTYYRFVFDGVTINEQTASSVFLDVYYLDSVDYNATPYGTLRLYDHLSEWLPYNLSSADKKALIAPNE